MMASWLAMNLEVWPMEKMSSAISHSVSKLLSPLANPCPQISPQEPRTSQEGTILAYLQVCLKVPTQHIEVHLVQVVHGTVCHALK